MKTKSFFLSLLLLPLFISAQQARTVDNRANSGANFTGTSALQDAIAASSAGDTLYVHPSSTTYGGILITKRLIIVGLSHNPANSKNNQRAILGDIFLIGDSANSLLTGLQCNVIGVGVGLGPITNVSNIRIVNNRCTNNITGYGGNTNPTDNWVIEGNIIDNGYVSPADADGWIIKNNIFNQSWKGVMDRCLNTTSFINNIVISSSGEFATNSIFPIVNNNIIILTGTTSTLTWSSSTIVFNNNLTYNPNSITITPLNGTANLDNTDPEFISAPFGTITEFYNNDYHLAPTSAAIGTGTGGQDLGVFQSYNFDVQGRPDLWPYMTSLDISNSSIPLGQDINVTFTAEKKN